MQLGAILVVFGIISALSIGWGIVEDQVTGPVVVGVPESRPFLAIPYSPYPLHLPQPFPPHSRRG